MDFTVGFYITEAGTSPIRDFLEKLKAGETMKKTDFDKYLEEQLKDPAFADRFERAGEAWDVALQISALRRQAGLSQKDLAKLLKTSQQQVSRLESPGYEGHSLSMLRRLADALHAKVRVVFEPAEKGAGMKIAESNATYLAKSKSTAIKKAQTEKKKRKVI